MARQATLEPLLEAGDIPVDTLPRCMMERVECNYFGQLRVL